MHRPFLSAVPWILSWAFFTSVDASEQRRDASPVVVRIGDRELRLSELDAAGGRAFYDAASLLHEARTRALYDWLSSELLKRESQARGLSEHQLIEEAITARLSSITEVQIDAVLTSEPGAPIADAKRRKQAQLYLGMKQHADAKRDYVASLMTKYHVTVSLPTPGALPAEEIRGAQSPILGAPNAPISIVVFSDYQCPYCRELSHTIDALLKRFPEQIRVIYRHYPLREATRVLAHAALCAADQDQFARYHEWLFESDLKDRDPQQIADALGLDVPAFARCMKEGRHEDRIAADQAEARRLGLQGTPTLFIEGQRLRGAQTLERLVFEVEQALAARERSAKAPNYLRAGSIGCHPV